MIEASAWLKSACNNDVRQLRRFLSPIISIDLLHLYLQPLGFDCFSLHHHRCTDLTLNLKVHGLQCWLDKFALEIPQVPAQE